MASIWTFILAKMTDILCRWLNEDVKLSRIIGKSRENGSAAANERLSPLY